jgi:hypothetical protein
VRENRGREGEQGEVSESEKEMTRLGVKESKGKGSGSRQQERDGNRKAGRHGEQDPAGGGEIEERKSNEPKVRKMRSYTGRGEEEVGGRMRGSRRTERGQKESAG